MIPKAGRQEHFLPNDHDLGRFHSWREQAFAYYEKLPQNDWECLAQAQHHGLATRLLDWTINPLVALYFACISQPNYDGAVYMYFPESFVDREKLPLNAPYNGIGFVARAVSSRILNQKGVFTVHNPVNKPIEVKAYSYVEGMPNLLKFIVPKELKFDLLKNLNTYGINHVTLFPDLDGLSQQINWETQSMNQNTDDEKILDSPIHTS